MATQTGTATGFMDLYVKLITFATTALGADNWTTVYGYEKDDGSVVGTPTLVTQGVWDNKIILRGHGSGGADEIYVGLKTVFDPDVQRHTIGIQAWNAYDVAKDYDNQVASSSTACTYVWDQDMAYWFIGSGRRIIAVFRMGTIYEILYFGFFLPYATPVDYPYPVLVGGCGNNSSATFASTGDNDFFINGRSGSSSIYTPSNTFVNAGNYDSNGSYVNASQGESSIFYLPYNCGANLASKLPWVREALDGNYVLTPIEMVGNGGYGLKGILGVVDGIYHVSGFGNYSENVVTINSVEYIVFQRVYRTSVDGFVALRWA